MEKICRICGKVIDPEKTYTHISMFKVKDDIYIGMGEWFLLCEDCAEKINALVEGGK